MLKASVCGAIDYSTDDNSPRFTLAESYIFDQLEADQAATWYTTLVLRNAVLSTGTYNLTADSVKKTREHYTKHMVQAQNLALNNLLPYVDTSKTDEAGLEEREVNEIEEIYKRVTGGYSNSPEAKKFFDDIRNPMLDAEKAAREQSEAEAAVRSKFYSSRKSLYDTMRPRNRRKG